MRILSFAFLLYCLLCNSLRAQYYTVPDSNTSRMNKVHVVTIFDSAVSTTVPAYHLYFDKHGRLFLSIDEISKTQTETYYDIRNRVICKTAKRSDGTFMSKRTTTYDDNTNTRTETWYSDWTDSADATEQFVFDQKNNLIRYAYYPYVFQEYYYNAFGKRVATKDSSRQWRLVTITMFDRVTEKRIYDENWKLTNDFYIHYLQPYVLAKSITDSVSAKNVHRYEFVRDSTFKLKAITENGLPVSERQWNILSNCCSEVFDEPEPFEVPPMNVEEGAPKHKLIYDENGTIVKDIVIPDWGGIKARKIYLYRYEYYK